MRYPNELEIAVYSQVSLSILRSYSHPPQTVNASRMPKNKTKHLKSDGPEKMSNGHTIIRSIALSTYKTKIDEHTHFVTF